MKRLRHFVKNIDGKEIYLVHIEKDNGEVFQVSFDGSGKVFFVDGSVWKEIEKEL